MLTLYDFPLSLNCYKVRLLLALLKVDYQRETIDLLTGEHKTSKFLAANPFGQVPALRVDDVVLRDSQAILVWIARTYGAEAWMPRDPTQEAEVNAWLAAAAYEVRLGPYDARLAKLLPALCVNVNAVKENTAHALKLYEDRLQDRKWLALDRPTVADIAAFPALSQCGDGDISLDNYGAIRAWLARVRQLAGFVALLG